MLSRQQGTAGGGPSNFLLGLASGAAIGIIACYGAIRYLERSGSRMPKILGKPAPTAEELAAVRSYQSEQEGESEGNQQRRALAGMPQLQATEASPIAAERSNREADSWMEEEQGTEEEARASQSSLPSVKLVKAGDAKREADPWIEEDLPMGEEAGRPGESSLPPVKLVKIGGAKRCEPQLIIEPLKTGMYAPQLNDTGKITPEALREEAVLKVHEACVLEREAGQLDQQGKAGPAKEKLNKAKDLRYRADRLQSQAVLLANRDAAWQRAPAAQHQGTAFCELVEVLREEVQERTAPVSMGSLDTERWAEMQSDADLECEVGETLRVTGSPTVPEYSWGDSDECTERQIQHLRNIINTGGGETEWVNAAQDYPELLSGQLFGHFITAATTDVLAAERSAVSAGSPQRGMRLLMDIRRTIAISDVEQAQARLLLGNLRCPKLRPVLVVTDLIDEWLAMWLDGSIIYQHAFADRGPAVGFIRDLLAGRHAMRRAISRTTFAKRRQIEDRLCVNFAETFAQRVKAFSMPPPSMRSSS